MRTLPPLYAHRLGRDAGPDSSPAALAATLAAGADGLETDVCLTADAELEAKGIQFNGDIIDSGVCHMANFRDPDGNALMFHSRYAPKE